MIDKRTGKVKLLLLGQHGEEIFFETEKLVRQLSLLWRFQFRVVSFPEESTYDNNIIVSFTHVVVCYATQNINYENWCCDLLDVCKSAEILMVDCEPKFYGAGLSKCFGIEGTSVVKKEKRIKVCQVGGNSIVSGLPRQMILNGDPAIVYGDIKLNNANCILKTTRNKIGCLLSSFNSRYCITIPFWRIGVPEFPYIITILKNFIFFIRGTGCFSPLPYAAIRIDDYPLTSQQYLKSGGASDDLSCDDIKTLCSWAQNTGAKLEFMVNSKIMDKNGSLVSIDEFMPKSLSLLKKYYKAGLININAHGRSHVDENKFLLEREISPFEFKSLSGKETEEHLLDNILFLRKAFGKNAKGFVPPSWGYLPELTKSICAKFFSFIIDSNQHYRTLEDCQCMGWVDECNVVHLIETWHIGRRYINYADKDIWAMYINNGIPVHIMSHGLYIYDPLPKDKIIRLIFLFSIVLVLPFLLLICPGRVWSSLKNFNPLIKWNRLGVFRSITTLLPYFKNASMCNLFLSGKKYGVQWCFPEELADYFREYRSLRLLDYKKYDGIHNISFYLDGPIGRPILFHLPKRILSATLDDSPILADDEKMILEISELSRGRHTLVVFT